jgi:hypothetical protein
MLQNGKYSVWYRTPRGEGMGTVTLHNGRVFGGDLMLGYSGSFEEDGDQFKANVSTWRHTAGEPSVFGLDEVDIFLKGKSTAGITASCSGFAKQLPDLSFEATLIRIAD